MLCPPKCRETLSRRAVLGLWLPAKELSWPSMRARRTRTRRPSGGLTGGATLADISTASLLAGPHTLSEQAKGKTWSEKGAASQKIFPRICPERRAMGSLYRRFPNTSPYPGLSHINATLLTIRAPIAPMSAAPESSGYATESRAFE
jgi:hypothetical protein